MSRKEQIHSKGFDLHNYTFSSYDTDSVTDFNKIKVGVKKLEDAILSLGNLKKSLPTSNYTNKNYIYKKIAENDVRELRNISNFFYNSHGIYQRVCDYFAFLYRYDWYVVPEIYDDKGVKEDKIMKDFHKVLSFLDNSYIKKICGDIALSVIINGAYYAYIVPNSTGLTLQQLPIEYCRVRYFKNNMPVVEFNMSYFDTFADTQYRMKVLNLFPDEFKKGYILYKQNRLKNDAFDGDTGWFMLDPESTIKFNFNGGDFPMFVNAIPYLLDLDAAQDLDRRKQMQKLLKIIVQKLPLDKNGDLIFDVDEARDIHNNAVAMLQHAVGTDVITTFADVDSIDMSDKNTTTTTDDLAKVERAAFNAFGISQNLFNTDGNLSLEKSILNDESSVRNLLFQFGMFFDRVAKAISVGGKKYSFKLYMLETTQYNYKELSKLYKEQTQLGYSKMLPQIALGHSQSFILNTAKFENEILHLTEIMIPPLMSSTMSSEDVLGKKGEGANPNSQNKTEGNKSMQKALDGKAAGRPEKAESEKSEKTIQNKESMS